MLSPFDTLRNVFATFASLIGVLPECPAPPPAP